MSKIACWAIYNLEEISQNDGCTEILNNKVADKPKSLFEKLLNQKHFTMLYLSKFY